jgi:predicted HTH domain antitoxin
MATLNTEHNPFIKTILETKFHNDEVKFFEAVKEFFQKDSKVEIYEYNLLKAYDRGELSIGQIATILNLDKFEVMELLEKYNIPFINVDETYLEQELNAFN